MKTPRGEVSDSIIALANDEALLQKMSECKSPEEVYALVKDRVGMPYEQFADEMVIVHSYLQELETGLLTEEDLDAVAGGKNEKDQKVIDTTVNSLKLASATISLSVAVAGIFV